MSIRNQEIDDQAVEWAAKRALRDLTSAEQTELDAWLAADIRHLGAFTKARAVLARLDRASCVSVDDIYSPETPPHFGSWPRRTFLAGGAAAAGIAATFLFGIRSTKPGEDHPLTAPINFTTAVGQTREVLLSDGSVITLNTDSKVLVELTSKARNVHLLRGEALFDVAKDKARPFVVYAADAQVKAVGTSFSVSMLPQKPIQVVVREGVVELKRPKTAAMLVSANTRALASHDTPIIAEDVSSTAVARQLSWQYGRIAFDHRTLKEAAEEFQRYSDVQIVVDPAVADRTITGMFAANDPAGFAKAAATVYKLQIEVSDKEVRIFE